MEMKNKGTTEYGLRNVGIDDLDISGPFG